MKIATLTRFESTDQGTFGILRSDGLKLYMTELPWRQNERSKSCIPAGIYTASWSKSPRFGFCYRVREVPKRSFILLHSGNYAGDTDLGYLSNSHGCLLPAMKLGYLGGQKAGLLSSVAVKTLVEYFDKKDFILEIKNADIPSLATL